MQRTGNCYKHSTTAENDTARDSSYLIKTKKWQMGKWGEGGKLFEKLNR